VQDQEISTHPGTSMRHAGTAATLSSTTNLQQPLRWMNSQSMQVCCNSQFLTTSIEQDTSLNYETKFSSFKANIHNSIILIFSVPCIIIDNFSNIPSKCRYIFI
jgi:hypothetical protein